MHTVTRLRASENIRRQQSKQIAEAQAQIEQLKTALKI